MMILSFQEILGPWSLMIFFYALILEGDNVEDNDDYDDNDDDNDVKSFFTKCI